MSAYQGEGEQEYQVRLTAFLESLGRLGWSEPQCPARRPVGRHRSDALQVGRNGSNMRISP
jgi:hypothetical protein